MSEYKGKIVVGVILAVIIAFGLAGVTMLIAPQSTPSSMHSQQAITNSGSSTAQGGQSMLLVQLTDPPLVPVGTTALNLTYDAIILLVGEPSVTTVTSISTVIEGTSTSAVTTNIMQTQSGVVTPQSITITPTGGSASVNLLQLQNISRTLASASLPNGSTIHSVTFDVSSIKITINNVTSPVTLATGGTTLLVTLAKPASLLGTNAMLVDLTPTVVNTTTGYQIIPSAVGIIRPQSEITSQQQQVGHEENLTNQDHTEIHNAVGQVTMKLLSLSVAGNTTTIKVQVNNTGNASVHLVAINVHGNFSQNGACITTSGNRDFADHSQRGCDRSVSPDLVLVANSTSSTSGSASSGCTSAQLYTLHDNHGRSQDNQLTLPADQCVTLTFSGIIPFGQSGVVIPSTQLGQQYAVQVIASNNAEVMLNCTLQASTISCTPIHSNSNGED